MKRHAPLGALFAAVSAAAGACRGAAPQRGDAALAAALGNAADVLVTDVAWEPSSGFAADATRGRWALFLGHARGELADVWRARVRVSSEGRPVEIVEVHDLTETPLGDEHGLVVSGRHAAFASRVYGQETGVTLLDLAGEGAENTASSASDRFMSCITNVQRAGTCAGIARVDVTWEKPAKSATVSLSPDALSIDLVDDDAGTLRPIHAELSLASFTLSGAAGGLHAQPETHLPKRLTHWAVDTVRAVSWIGPRPITWLEDLVFAVKDAGKRLLFRVGGGHGGDVVRGQTDAPPPVLDASAASIESAHWPPQTVPTFWKTPRPGEGEWVPPDVPWIRTLDGAPPPLLRTFVRPDEDRPWAVVTLVAVDTRQTELEMEGGTEDPRPLAGPPGTGRIPRDPAIVSRVLAAWNGGFKTEHGTFGMMVHKRVLLPPQPGAASVITLKDGRVGMGSWGKDKTFDEIVDVPAEDIVSMRQNLDALVDKGVINPAGRNLWGYAAPGKTAQTERSGMCVTSAGHVLYAWSDDASAITLAKAMKMAGCDYGMHLDMNGAHAGFIFARVEDVGAKRYQTELLSPLMGIPKDRYIQPAPKDFFYVLLRDPSPPPVEGGAPWSVDAGVQPSPSWLPGLWAAKAGDVELVDVEAERVTWRIRAGAKDVPLVSPSRELSGDDAQRAILAVGLGRSTSREPRGLATDGKLYVPISSKASGVIVAPPGQGLVIVEAREVGSPAPGVDFAEVPLLFYDGARFASDGEQGEGAALGTTPEGRVVVARGDLAALADALERAGCTRAVRLDRGGATPAFRDRAGTVSPPLARYDDTVVYAIAQPMKPRGFRFDAAVAAVKKPPSWNWPF